MTEDRFRGIDAEKTGKIHSGKLCLVVSNKSDAYALTRAAEAGIPTEAVLRRDYPTSAAYEDALQELLEKNNIGLIVLAGFLVILSGKFTSLLALFF